MPDPKFNPQEEPIEVSDDMIEDEAHEGEEQISAEDAEAAVKGAEHAARQKIARLREQLKEGEEELAKVSADQKMPAKLKKATLDALDSEQKVLRKEIEDTIRKHEIKEEPEKVEDKDILGPADIEIVTDDQIVGEPTHEELMKADEAERLTTALADADAKLSRVGFDLQGTGIQEQFETLSDKAATSMLGKARLAFWRLGLSSKMRGVIDEYSKLQNEKTAILKAQSELKITPAEVARMRAARGRQGEQAKKTSLGGRFSK